MFALMKNATDHGIKASCKEENEDLFAKIMKGKEASRRLAEGNMAYAVDKVEHFLDEHPTFTFLRDDLISEGLLVLSRLAAEYTKNSEGEYNPQALMSVSLRNAFLNVIRLEREVSLTDAVASKLYYFDDTLRLNELMEAILSCCVDQRERKIIRLRSEGESDADIATLVDLSKSQVCRLRQGVYERFLEKFSR